MQPPTIVELLQLLRDAGGPLFQEQRGERSVYTAQKLSEEILSLANNPAGYACVRAHVDEALSRGIDLGLRDIFVLTSGEHSKHWCAKAGEREAVLASLVEHLGASRAQRLILEVHALDRPLTATQWRSYVQQADGAFQGLPTVMWVKLI